MAAHTEDIAEKVANLLLNETAKATNFAIDSGATLVKGAGVMTKQALKKLIEKSKNDKEIQKLMSIEGELTPAQMNELVRRLGLKTSTVRIAESDVKEYETLLRKNNVLFSKVAFKDDNAKMFIFLSSDREKVQNVSTIMQASRGKVTEVAPDLYFKNLAPDKARMLSGLDRVEMELFRQYARQENLLFTSIKHEDSKYSIVYDAAQDKTARKTMLHVGWDLTGPNGRRNREQVEHRLHGRSAVQISAEEGKQELYIVSKNNPENFMNITAEGFSYYKMGKKIGAVPRNSPDFFTRCMAQLDGIANAVVLNEFQYHPGITHEDIKDKPTIDLHDREYDMLMEMDRQNNLINLVAMKSSHDDEHNDTWGIWDTSVSYAEFAGYEYIMDEEEREARAYEFDHFKDAAFYSKNRFIEDDINLDEKNLDLIIQKAEAKRKSYESREPERTRDYTPNNNEKSKEDDLSF